MTSLRELQTQFQNAIDQNIESMHAHINTTPHFNKETRLAIYQDGYTLRLIEALESDYPKLQILLEEERFKECASNYIASSPSYTKSLRWYGSTFGEWLQKNSNLMNRVAYGEVAKFEWALLQSFDAIDEPILTLSDLATLDPAHWPELTVKFSAAFQFWQSEYNSVALWQAAAALEPAPQITKASKQWKIWRKQRQTYFMCLQPYELNALQCLQAGGNVSDLCTVLCEYFEVNDTPMQAATLLKSWIEDEMVCVGSNVPGRGSVSSA